MLKALSTVFIACVALVATEPIFKDCGSQESKINSVVISNCAAIPCIFHKKTYVNVTVDFTANADIQNATNKVFGIILGHQVPFHDVNLLACKNMACPVSKDKSVVYKNSVYVEPIFPDIELIVKWEVVDVNNKTVFCFVVPVQIK